MPELQLVNDTRLGPECDVNAFASAENIIGKTFSCCGIFTTRKRSLGQGNIFTPVCLSTGGAGGRRCCDVTPCYRQQPPPPWTAPFAPDITFHPGPHSQTTPPPGTVEERAARILLECFLVFFSKNVPNI